VRKDTELEVLETGMLKKFEVSRRIFVIYLSVAIEDYCLTVRKDTELEVLETGMLKKLEVSRRIYVIYLSVATEED
jgi:hypothetical protein